MTRPAVRIAIVAACLAAVAATAIAATPTMPTFLARRDYTGLDSYSVQVGDTNGDGIPDLLADSEGEILVLFGNSDGTFRSGTSQRIAPYGPSFVVADLNSDGTVDVVAPSGAAVYVALGNGDGTFQNPVMYLPGIDSGVYYAVVGDFNGDGILDIATAGNMGVWLFTGNGDGTFNPGVLAASLPQPYPFGGVIAAADFNGDGKLDLVVSLPWGGGVSVPGQGIAVLLGNGNGSFQAPIMLSPPKNVLVVAAGKLPNGHVGIVVSNDQNSDIYAFYGNGAGGFSGPHAVNLPGNPGVGGIAIGDVNGDGIPDLVSSGGYIALGTSSGTFKSPIYYPVQDGYGGANQLVLADLRRNGLTDIITNDYFAISVLLSQGKGRYLDGGWTKVTGAGGCGAAADYNGDGKPDLALSTSTGISILLGTGKVSPSFTTGTSFAVTGAACVITGDLNGDGIPDLLVAVNGTPNALLSYLGNGDGTFTLKGTTPTPNSGGYVILADFNHDGKLDFATSGNLIALGNGDGTFQTPIAIVSSPPSSGFSNITVGDINNDGWPDLVLTNDGIPYVNVYVLLSNQHGGFNQVPTTFGALTNQAILADLNGDGNLDLVIQGISSGGAFIYLGDGTGGFAYDTVLLGSVNVPGINMVADLNGDGIPDVALLETDTMTIYLGLGGATYAAPFSIGTGPEPGALLVENLHGQRASAGRPDIVVPDFSGGVTVLINATK